MFKFIFDVLAVLVLLWVARIIATFVTILILVVGLYLIFTM